MLCVCSLPNFPMLLTFKIAANALNQNNAPTLQATIIMSLSIAESVILRDVKFHSHRSSENQNILRENFKNCKSRERRSCLLVRWISQEI